MDDKIDVNENYVIPPAHDAVSHRHPKPADDQIEKVSMGKLSKFKEEEAAGAVVSASPDKGHDDHGGEPETAWLKSKLQIMKNLLVISFAWVFLFTAYQSMANLQSSLNSDQGLGTASLSSIYVTLVISCLFVPPIMIRNLGLKWTIVFSQCTYLLFMAANMYPKWYILMPGIAGNTFFKIPKTSFYHHFVCVFCSCGHSRK